MSKLNSIVRVATVVTLAVSLSACSTSEIASRNAPMDLSSIAVPNQTTTQNLSMQQLNFAVSSGLRVSEANGYYPMADIVWRGDVIGDRRQQIGAMFQEAANRVVARQSEGVPVVVNVELVRFHGVTERTRYSVGGNYNIVFMMSVLHAETGAVIFPARKIVGDLSAPGGIAAMAADQAGQTEKVRVTDYLTMMLQDEMLGQTLS